MTNLMKTTLTKIKKLFAVEEDAAQKNSRIESAKITSNRLKALQRMRENSPTTPDYKLEGMQEEPTKTTDNIDLDFGMEIRA